jgi:serine/threonine protein kinase/lipopolysaccharide biosynthesis regulator YciM
MNVDPARVRAVFLEAVEKHPPGAWDQFLDEACTGDAELRRQVAVLLDAHRQAGSFLAQGAVAPARTVDQPAGHEAAGTVVGPYKLLQQIGEGGMGTVFMAAQTQPVQRKVALKIIKPGMDSRQVIGRFEAERQALAMMDHVNIARVFDGGATSAGRPYFVMELVHGVPITKYCDDNHLTPRERLELFVPVCQAIQHAHQKGIIHRDVKPSNIMVTLYDGKPVPKVIDFGVAKATEQKLTERTLFTQFGTMVGTFEYMSPEQAEMSALGVDTRSDIFSLGVLLYELLTGSTPLTRQRMKEAAYAEILRMIKEEEPPRPSTRLSDTGEALASIAAQRKTEPAKLMKLVRGELDWIVMKALEKDRNRRYETANSFAIEVQRYLADEPVQACPPSAGYRLRKFMRRNKGPVAAAAIIFLLLVGGIAGTATGLLAALRQRDAAVDARQDAERETLRATGAEQLASTRLIAIRAEKERADEERDTTQAINDFVREDLLGQAALQFQKGGPDGKRDPNITVRTALDRAAEKVESRFAKKPRVAAAVHATLARVYYELGMGQNAQRHAERSVQMRLLHLGPDDRDTLASQVLLALALYNLHSLERMETILLDVIQRQTATLGPDHLDTLSTKNVLASFSLDPDRPNYARAAELLEEVVPKRAARLGEDHRDTLVSKQNLAWLYRQTRAFDRAAALFRELLDVYRTKYGENDPTTLICKSNLGLVYLKSGKFDEAEPILLDVLQKRIAAEGDDESSTNVSRYYLANLYQHQRKHDRAIPLYERALAAHRKSLGATDATFQIMDELAQTHLMAGQPEKALPLLEEMVTGRRKELGATNPKLAAKLIPSCAYLLKHGQHAAAERYLRECVAIGEKIEPESWSTLNARSMLGAALLGQKKYADAEPLLKSSVDAMRRREVEVPATSKPQLTDALERLVQLYSATGRATEAAELRKELEARKKSASSDNPAPQK